MSKNESLLPLDELPLETFGQRIVFCRRRAGLSQPQLAERVGVLRNAVYKWESGPTVPRVEVSARLAVCFSVELRWLQTGQGRRDIRRYPDKRAGLAPAHEFSPLYQALWTAFDAVLQRKMLDSIRAVEMLNEMHTLLGSTPETFSLSAAVQETADEPQPEAVAPDDDSERMTDNSRGAC